MAELAARSAGAGAFPIHAGALHASEVVPDGLWSVMPLKEVDMAGALPCGWPEPGRAVEGGGRRAIWFGRDAALVTGPRPEGLDGRAAVTDQADAWVVVRLEGAGGEAALSRLVPIDLRAARFPDGSVARTMLGHLGVAVVRVGEAFELWAFRSMAGTLAHELARAMRGVAARGAPGGV